MASFTETSPGFCNPIQFSAPHYAAESSQQIKSKVNKLIKSASDLSNQILSPKTIKYEGPIVIREHYYPVSPFFYLPWYYPRPSVIVVDRFGHHRTESRDNTARILLGGLAAIGAIFMAKVVGDAALSLKDSQRELNNNKEEVAKLNHLQANSRPEDQELLGQAAEALELKGRICSRIRNSSIWDLNLRVSLTVGLILTSVGAFVCLPVALAGLILSVVSASAIMFKWGFDSNDADNIRDAQELKEKLSNLKEL